MQTASAHRRLPARRRLAVAVLGSLAIGLSAAVSASVPAGAAALPPPPPVPSGLPAQIEDLQPYVGASSCTQSSTAGAQKLADLLQATYGVGSGIVRECGSSRSEHFEGRAVDWMTSMRTSAGAARANSFLNWVFAKDSAGNAYAMVRRLGIMYIIWNDRMWSAYDPARGWKPYSNCASHPESSYDTTCHRDHVHISLGWSGATASTSYWTRRVARTDYGPCRPRDLNWAAPYVGFNPARCAEYPTVKAPAGSSSTTTTLFANSGIVLRKGMTGTVVKAAQKRLGTTADGSFGSSDAAAVSALQARAGLARTDVVDHPTWRALLGLPQLVTQRPPLVHRAVPRPGPTVLPPGTTRSP